MQTRGDPANGRSSTSNRASIKQAYMDNDGLFHYTSCGLDNVYLRDGFNLAEDDKSYSISQLEDLHRCIAVHLIQFTSMLTGKELRFLRKEMNLTQADLAKRMGVDKQTVGRWEKDETENSTADRMVRMLYLTMAQSHTGDNVISILDSVGELDDTEHRQWVFNQKERQEWRKCG